MFNNTLMALY